MDNPNELERIKNYKPSIDDLKMKSPESVKLPHKEWPEGRENIKSIEQKIHEILNNNDYSIHPSRLEEYQLREAVKYLAYRLQILEQIVKAYKTGKL